MKSLPCGSSLRCNTEDKLENLSDRSSVKPALARSSMFSRGKDPEAD